MDNFYRENILDHYRDPRNKCQLDNPTHSHEEHNPLCGDRVQIELHVNDEQIIDEICFDGKGCAISMASASMLTEMVEGQSLDTAKALSKEDILEALGIEIGPVRLKCALLSLKTLKASIYGLSDVIHTEEEDW